MENLAKIFDQPVDSAAHREFAADCWLGGDMVSMRYWLGRLLHRNFFRESHDAVKVALHQHLVERGCEKGACLAADIQSWGPIGIVLQFDVDPKSSRRNPRAIAAIDAVLQDPELSDTLLAAAANTTEKQIARMSDVFVLRKIWKLQHPQTRSQDRRLSDE